MKVQYDDNDDSQGHGGQLSGKTLADTPVPARRSAGARKGLIFLGVLTVLFLVFVGVRISGALGTRAEAQKKQAAATVEIKAQAGRPPSVAIVRGRPVAWTPAVPFEGTLSAQKEADLGFKAPGRLARILGKVGDKVAAGKILATLETSEADAQLKAAEAQVTAAQAQAALAEDAARRTAQVVKSGAQTEAAGVQAEKQQQLAEAQANAARAQSDLARTALNNHTLAAPFAGTLTRAPNAPGAVVAPGVPLFHLADLGTLKLVGTISPEDARLVKVGTAVEVHGDGSDKTVIARGQVSAVVHALDAATKRLPVEAVVGNEARGGASQPGASEPLIAGSVVRAVLRGAAPITVLAFPHTVLRPGSQNEVVVVRAGKLSLRTVEHVVAEDGSLLVRKGLRPDDEVVVAPWPEVQEGQEVLIAKGERP
jgi:RND family efflux transporter MFP subunit